MRAVLIVIFLTLGILNLKGQTTLRNPLDSSLVVVITNVKNGYYPSRARKAGIQGTVNVKLEFDAECNVKKREIINSIGYGCDEAAMNYVKNIQGQITLQIKNRRENKCRQGYEWIIPVQFKLAE
jgi:TonB family protein